MSVLLAMIGFFFLMKIVTDSLFSPMTSAMKKQAEDEKFENDLQKQIQQQRELALYNDGGWYDPVSLAGQDKFGKWMYNRRRQMRTMHYKGYWPMDEAQVLTNDEVDQIEEVIIRRDECIDEMRVRKKNRIIKTKVLRDPELILKYSYYAAKAPRGARLAMIDYGDELRFHTWYDECGYGCRLCTVPQNYIRYIINHFVTVAASPQNMHSISAFKTNLDADGMPIPDNVKILALFERLDVRIFCVEQDGELMYTYYSMTDKYRDMVAGIFSSNDWLGYRIHSDLTGGFPYRIFIGKDLRWARNCQTSDGVDKNKTNDMPIEEYGLIPYYPVFLENKPGYINVVMLDGTADNEF